MKTIRINLLGLALATTSVAMAQSLAPDGDMTQTLLFTDGGNAIVGQSGPTFLARAKAVGYYNESLDALQVTPNVARIARPIFAGAQTVGTSQSIFNSFKVPANVPAGKPMQLGFHAWAADSLSSAAFTDFYVSIFQDDSGVSSGVPIGASLIQNVRVRVGRGDSFTPNSQLWYSSRFSLSAGLNAGTKYWMAVAPATAPNLSANVASVGAFMALPFDRTGLAGQGLTRADFERVYLYNNNSAAAGGAAGLLYSSGDQANSLSYRLLGANTTVNVTGTVTLDTWSPSPSLKTVMVEVVDSAQNVVYSASLPLDNNGNYAFGGTFPVGTYSVKMTADTFLRRTIPSVVLNSTTSGVDFSLVNGDVVDDNVVDLSDYTAVAVAFNAQPVDANWNPAADVNGDLVVDLTDYTVIAVNFNSLGDN
jgi:hypothetical protein